MKSFIFIFLFFFNINSVLAQNRIESPKFNIISFQIGKQGILFNINYDHKFQNKNWGYKVETGTSFTKDFRVNTFAFGNYILKGQNTNFLELGLDINYLYSYISQDDVSGSGLTFFYDDYNTLYPNLNIGYRKYYKRGMFRLGFAPGYLRDRFLYGGYVSIGIKL